MRSFADRLIFTRPPHIIRSVSDRLINTRLRDWRKVEGLSLMEVSGLTGVSVPMLSLVERGLRQLAPLTRVRVARRLGLPVQELFPPEPLEDEERA